MINSNPSREYRVIFALNMTIILFFILVFSFEWFCALRRRIVAIRNGESAAEELHPRWFTIHRCSPKMIRDTLVIRRFACRFKRFKALVKMLLTNRSVLEVRTAFLYDLIDFVHLKFIPRNFGLIVNQALISMIRRPTCNWEVRHIQGVS